MVFKLRQTDFRGGTYVGASCNEIIISHKHSSKELKLSLEAWHHRERKCMESQVRGSKCHQRCQIHGKKMAPKRKIGQIYSPHCHTAMLVVLSKVSYIYIYIQKKTSPRKNPSKILVFFALRRRAHLHQGLPNGVSDVRRPLAPEKRSSHTAQKRELCHRLYRDTHWQN